MYLLANIVLLALSSVWPTQGGTIVVYDFSSSRLIVAADSLAHDYKGRIVTKSECKILRLSNQVFFFDLGRTEIAAETKGGRRTVLINTVAIAKEALAAANQGHGGIEVVADKWSEKMMLRYGEIIRTSGTYPVIFGLHDDLVITGGFISVDDGGNPSFYVNKIRYRLELDGKITLFRELTQQHPDPGRVTAMSHGVDAVMEFAVNQTERAHKMHERLDEEAKRHPAKDFEALRVAFAVKAAIDWSADPLIGGPVDVLIIERGSGARWFQRKENCKDKWEATHR